MTVITELVCMWYDLTNHICFPLQFLTCCCWFYCCCWDCAIWTNYTSCTRCTAVNFAKNIQAAFCQYSFAKIIHCQIIKEKNCTKHFCTKKLLIICWWNWHLHLEQLTFEHWLKEVSLPKHLTWPATNGIVPGRKKEV